MKYIGFDIFLLDNEFQLELLASDPLSLTKKVTHMQLFLHTIYYLRIGPVDPQKLDPIPSGEIVIYFKSKSPVFDSPLFRCEKHGGGNGVPVFALPNPDNCELTVISGAHMAFRWKVPQGNRFNSLEIPIMFTCCSNDADRASNHTTWGLHMYYWGDLSEYSWLSKVSPIKVFETASKVPDTKRKRKTPDLRPNLPESGCLTEEECKKVLGLDIKKEAPPAEPIKTEPGVVIPDVARGEEEAVDDPIDTCEMETRRIISELEAGDWGLGRVMENSLACGRVILGLAGERLAYWSKQGRKMDIEKFRNKTSYTEEEEKIMDRLLGLEDGKNV